MCLNFREFVIAIVKQPYVSIVKKVLSKIGLALIGYALPSAVWTRNSLFTN